MTFLSMIALWAVDLLGPMLGSREAAKVYGAGRFRVAIINTASIAGTHAGYGIPEYRAAKAGVIALTKIVGDRIGAQVIFV